MTRLPTSIAAFFLAMLLSAGLSLPALAHAQLLSSDPAPQAVLATAPESAVLQFNEPVSPVVLSLIGPTARTCRSPGRSQATR